MRRKRCPWCSYVARWWGPFGQRLSKHAAVAHPDLLNYWLIATALRIESEADGSFLLRTDDGTTEFIVSRDTAEDPR